MEDFKIRVGAELDKNAGKQIQDGINKIETKPIEVPFKIDLKNTKEIEKEMNRVVSKLTNGKGSLVSFKIDKDSIFDKDLGKRIERLQGVTLNYKNAVGEVVSELYKMRQIGTEVGKDGTEEAIMGWAKATSNYSQNVEQSNKNLMKQKELIEQMNLLQIKANKSNTTLNQDNISGFKTASTNNNIAEMTHYLNLAKTEYSQLNALMEKQLPMTGLENMKNNIGSMPIDIQNVETSFKKLLSQPEELRVRIEQLRNSYKSLDAFKGSEADKVKQYNLLKTEISGVTKEVQSLIKVQQQEVTISERKQFYNQIGSYLRENTKLPKQTVAELQKLQDKIKSVDKTGFNTLKKEFRELTSETKALGQAGKSTFDKFKGDIGNFLTFVTAGGAVMSVIRSLRDMVYNVKELDDQLLELSKVSDLSSDDLEKVTKRAYELGDTVGKTGTQVLAAITSFKRAGYELDESMRLAKDALKMTNVAEGINDAGIAAENLIHIIKGFGEDSDFSSKILDSINQVSNTQAIDFDNLVDGAERLSAVANQAGLSFDQMLGVLTGGYEVLGNMEKTASGLITIFSRLRSVQLDGEEQVKGISELQEVFNKATKGVVNIVDETTGQLRNTYDVLDELNSIWDTLDKNTQEGLSFEAAGTRQKSVFLSIMQNWNNVKESVESATNSMGSADIENQKYLDSLSGRLSIMSSKFEDLSQQVIDDDFLKVLVSSGTNAIEVLTKIIEKLGLFPTLLTTISGILSARGNIGIFQTDSSGITNIFSELSNKSKLAETAIEDINDALLNYNTNIRTSAIELDAFNKIQSTDTMTSYLQSLKGGEATLQGYNASLVASEASTIGLTIATTALNMAITMGLSLAIQAIVTAINKYINANKEAISTANELTENYRSSINSFKSNTATLDGLKDEFNELSKGVDENGKNIGLTAEQYKRYKEIVSQIIDISPDLIKGYDSEGNALVNNNTLLKDAIELQKQLNEQKKQEYLSSGSDILKGVRAEIDKVKKGLDPSPLNIALVGGNLLKGDFNALWKIYEELGINSAKLASGDVESYKKIVELKEILIQKATEEFNLTEKQKQTIRNRIDLLDVELDKIDVANQKIQSYMSTWASAEGQKDWFGKINTGFIDEFQQQLSDISSDPTMSLEEMQVTAKNLGLSFVEMQDKIPTAKIEELKTQLKNGTISEEEFNKQLKINIGYIYLLASAYDKTNPSLAEFIRLIAEGYTDFANATEKLVDNSENVSQLFTEEQNKEIDNFQSSISVLSETLKKLDSGSLSDSDMVDLIQQFPELEGHTDDLSSAIEDLVQNKLKSLISILKSAGASDEFITMLTNMTNSIFRTNMSLQDWQKQLSTVSSSISKLKDILEEVNSKDFKAISEQSLSAIISDYPELLEYINDENALREELIKTIGEEEEKQKLAYVNIVEGERQKLIAANNTINGMIQNSNLLVKELGEAYQVDLTNFKSIVEAKAKLEEELIRNSAKAWQQYYQVQVDASTGLATVTSNATRAPANDAELQRLNEQMNAANASANAYNEAITRLNGIVNGININVSGGGKAKGGGGSSKKSFSETIDWTKQSIEILENAVNKFEETMDSSDPYSKQIDDITKLMKLQSKLADGYKNQSKEYEKIYKASIKGISKYKDEIESGKVFKVEDFKNEATYNAVKQAQEYYNMLQDALANEAKTRNEIKSNKALKAELKIRADFEEFDKELAEKTKSLSQIDVALSLVDEDTEAQLLLLQTGYQQSSAKAKMLSDEIKALNKQFKNDKNNELYIERLEDLTNQLNETAQAMKSYKDSIISYMQERLDAQIDAIEKAQKDELEAAKKRHEAEIKAYEDEAKAYQKIIDARKEALRLAREQHNYEKSIKESIESIAEIQDRIAELDKAAKTGDREAAAEKRELEKQLADENEDLAEKQYDREMDLAEDALDKAADDYEEAHNKKIELLKQLHEQELENINKAKEAQIQAITELYDKQAQLIINAAQLTRDEFTSAFADINSQLSSFGITQSSGFKQSMMDYYDSTSKLSSVTAVLNRANGTGAGTSSLNQYVQSIGYNQLSYANMAELASLLGIGNYSANDIKKDSSIKKLIEKELKKLLSGSTFATGGIAKSMGEDGWGLIKKNELILNENGSKVYTQQLVPLMKDFVRSFNLSMPSSSPVVNNKNLSPNINIPITIMGNANSKTVSALNSASNNIVKQIMNEVKKM